MVRLGERDLRSLLACAGEIAGVEGPEQLPAAVFSGLRRLVPCQQVVYDEIDLRTGRSTALGDPPDPADLVNPAWEHVMDQHPGLQNAARTGDDGAHSISEFLTRRPFHRLELYQDVYRPMEVDDELGAIVRIDGGLMITVAVSRRGRNFSERERARLEAARPWLARAYRGAVATARRRELVAALESALADEGRGLVELRGEGRLGYVSTRAAELLSRYLGTRRPRLVDVPATIDKAKGRLRIKAFQERWLVLVEELEPFADRGLTRREREVVVRATRGETNAEIAAALFLSPRTVDKHLQHAYEKLGVTGRREAARLLKNGPA